jgi:hypothetical protein
MPWADGGTLPRPVPTVESSVRSYAESVADAAEAAAAAYADSVSSVMMPGAPMVVGRYYLPFNHGGLTPIATTEASMQLSPFLVGRSCTLDLIGVSVGTVGSAGAGVRLGLYADDVTTPGVPGALVLDAGTVEAVANTGLRGGTISLTLEPGIYWTAMSVQGGAGTRPLLRAFQNATAYCYVGTSAGGNSAGASGFYDNGISGTLPATATLEGEFSLTSQVAVWLKASA